MNALAQVWLPFPPSVNNLFPTRIIRGRVMRVPSKDYTKWKKEADLRLMAARLRTMQVPVHVLLELTPRDKRARDADNYGKAILDALVRGRVLRDDGSKWVHAVSARWLAPSRLSVGVTVSLFAANVANPMLPGLFDETSLKAAI